jgi:hypothetical protein
MPIDSPSKTEGTEKFSDFYIPPAPSYGPGKNPKNFFPI